MTYDGFIDSTGGGLVRGWAFDPARADSPVEVELASSAGWAGTVLADEFRPDLKASGLGNGRHGFTFRLPPGAWRPGAPPTVTARIRGPGFELHGSPAPLGERTARCARVRRTTWATPTFFPFTSASRRRA